jgi:alpha-glucosidase
LAETAWWQRASVYEVYVRSFADANGDGVGDLRGVTTRLDYLASLGVDAVWLSPIFPSPMADFGYDVADYCNVDPLFGTLADFDALVSAAEARGLRLILDFVPNHTSDRHPWFLASRSSRDDPKRDWYLWRDPAPDGGAPNNWLSQFGGSAWEWDEGTGQYYLHSFLREQPDLNWRNPAVREAMYDVLRFWLERGIDGFRVDVLWLLIKDDEYRDNPVNPAWREGESSYERLLPLYTSDRPEIHDIVEEMRRVLDAYGECVLIGEIYLPVERLVTYYGRDLSGAHLPFNFALIGTAWNAEALASLIREYEAALPPGAWPNWVLGNHDKPRIATRVGAEQARVAAMLLLTLRGTPTLYYGDELGMVDVAIPPDAVRDPAELRQPGIGMGRDPQRTPMPWDASPLGGFTTGVPWLPLVEHERANVATLSGDPASILALYRRLIALRKTEPALAAGTLDAVAAHGSVLAYERRLRPASLHVMLNLGHLEERIATRADRVVLSTTVTRAGERVRGEVTLGPNEGVILVASTATHS